jgi:hypothetical protein
LCHSGTGFLKPVSKLAIHLNGDCAWLNRRTQVIHDIAITTTRSASAVPNAG